MDKTIEELEKLKKLAEKNDKDALEELARFYYQDGDDNNPKVDFNKAYYYLKNAISFNTADILHKYAMCNYYGLGTVKNIDEAYKYLMLAAEQNYPKSINNIGCMYKDGEVVEQDYDKAREYFERAAKLGSTLAINNIKKLDAVIIAKKLNNYHSLNSSEKELVEKELEDLLKDNENNYKVLITILNDYVYPALERNSTKTLESDEIKIIVDLSALIIPVMLNNDLIDDAKSLLEELIDLNSKYDGDIQVKINNNARLLWRLATILYVLGDLDIALEYNNRALELANRSFKEFGYMDEYDILVNINSLFLNIYRVQGDYDKAIDLGTSFIELYHTLPSEIQDKYQTQTTLFMLALSGCYIFAKDYDNAIKLIKPIINCYAKKEKTDLNLDILSQAQYHLGSIFFEKEDYHSAIDNFTDAICNALDITDPGSSALRATKYMLAYGRLLFRNDCYDEAISLYERIITLCSENDFHGRMEVYFECLDQISRSKYRLGNVKEAIEIINDFFGEVMDKTFVGTNYYYFAASMAYTMSCICADTKDYDAQKGWLKNCRIFLEQMGNKTPDASLLYRIVESDLSKL